MKESEWQRRLIEKIRENHRLAPYYRAETKTVVRRICLEMHNLEFEITSDRVYRIMQLLHPNLMARIEEYGEASARQLIQELVWPLVVSS